MPLVVFLDLLIPMNAKTRERPVMYQLLASNARKLVYREFFQFRMCRCDNALMCAQTFVSVVQHLLDHGTFNFKLTNVAVIEHKQYCRLKNKFRNAMKKNPT